MSGKTIRIASYNVRKARGLDQRRNPGRILEVVNGLGADVVVLQEADKRLGQRPTALPRELIEAETDLSLVELGNDGPGIGWHGNAVLVGRDIEVEGIDRMDLPGLEPRGAVRIRLAGGLTLVGTHLGLRRQDRLAQLAALEAATAGDARCVIAGDFNEWSRNRGFEPLLPRFEVHSPGRSFHARRPIAALDRFALSPGLVLRDAGVEEGRLARIASDHLPVWSEIAISPPTC